MRLPVLLIVLCLSAVPLHAQAQTGPYRGWDYLVTRLREDGFSDAQLQSVFGSPRMPEHEEIGFALAPKEHAVMYAIFTTPKKIDRAVRCLKENASAFKKAEQLFHVPRTVIAAILLIETQCGDNTGRELVVNRLARMASLNEPSNVKKNYERLKKSDPTVTLGALEQRADYLDEVFYPEVVALLRLTQHEKMDIFSIKGSTAGAFGLGQFLPSTFLRYAADGNRDGVIDLLNPEDAVWSVAHYLSAEGWNDKIPRAGNRDVIWKYNHSEPYIDAVLKVSILLDRRKIPV